MRRGGFGGGAWRGRAANVAVEVSEFPAWVRDCDKDFKEKACTLTHEGRTLGKWRAFVGRLEASSTNMFRRAARHRCSACQAATRSSGRSKKLTHNYGMPPLAVLIETDGCTCHEDIRSFLPDLDTAFAPSELLAPTKPVATGKRKKVQGAGAAARIRSSRAKLESGIGLDESEAAENIFGDEGLAFASAGQKEGEDGEAGGEKEGKEEGEGRRAGEEVEDDDDAEDDEDLELDDYENAGEHCDDDEDLVDEGGGGSDDEENRYGTL